MAEDISKNTIIILVILTVVISVLGTWTVLNEVNNIKVVSSGQPDSGESHTSGKVTLTVTEPPVNDATGKVILEKTR